MGLNWAKGMISCCFNTSKTVFKKIDFISIYDKFFIEKEQKSLQISYF